MRNAVLQGEQLRMLTFSLETETAIWNKFTQRRRTVLVQCLVYEATRDFVQFLTTKAKGRTVVCEGHVERSSQQLNGERKFRMDIVIASESIEVIK